MNDFTKLQKEFSNELTDNILNYWIKKVYDPRRKTFIGVIDENEKPDPEAPLGVVLIARILWTFSAAYHLYPTAIYKKMADEAWEILTNIFWDNENGGVYWSVSPSGKPVNDSKQFYAQSFALYAMAEYSRIFDLKNPKQLAVSLFHLIEKYALDPVYGGYFEARTKNWQSVARDFITPQNNTEIKKSMNTHLHIMEAYTNLFRICPQEDVGNQIVSILKIFNKYIINAQNHHFHMFFDAEWNAKTTAISYGHDIEGTWLLHEAAEVIQQKEIMEKIEPLILKMAEAVGNEALDRSGGLYNESDAEHWDRNFHWWPQAEAVVGFFNAYQLTNDKKFLTWSEDAWKFIRKYQIDYKHGEWFGMITPEYAVSPMDKVSAWKCPYHNARMCMEMIRRTEKYSKL
jgi:mannobiose 2-epimerase